MNLLNILPIEVQQSLDASLFIGLIIIAIISISWLISSLLHNYEIRRELKKLKKWRKFAEIEKRQNHEECDRLMTQLHHDQHLQSEWKEKHDQLVSELAEERSFNDTQGSMHVRLMLKYAHVQEESEKVKKEYDQLKEHYAGTMRQFEVLEKLGKVAETEIAELKAKLTRQTKRNEKGQFIKSKPEYIQYAGRVEIRDWTKASKEELLAEAKRRYPVGTKVKCLADSDEYVVKDHEFYSISKDECWVCSTTDLGIQLFDGTWAQIITE